MSINSTVQSETLSEQNLIPIYFIEDKLQENFKKINIYMKDNNQKRSFVTAQIEKLKNQQTNLRSSFTQKMQQMEKKIMYEISMQLQGRIAIAIGKSIDSFTEKIQQKEKNMNNMKDQFEKKLTQIKQDLKFQVSMQSQKSLFKQTKKLQQIIKKGGINTQQQKNYSSKTSNGRSNSKSQQNSKQSKDINRQQLLLQNDSQQWQQQHHQILALQNRIQAIQQFSINVDKRVYNGLTSIKQSWKELGTQLLQNKKAMNKKFDQLKVDFLKLKGLKQFSITPDKIQDEFKRKLNQKFTDIYQLLSITLTKNQYEAFIQKMNGKISRHDDQFMQMRKQLATNNQFFTFYINNADQEDLKERMRQIVQRLDSQKEQLQQNFLSLKNKDQQNVKATSQLSKNIKYIQKFIGQKLKQIDYMSQIVNTVKDRIENLQDFNRFGPDKLQRIHNALDVDFTATQRQLIDTKNKRQGLSLVEQSQREFRIQLSKIKDQLFLVTSQNQVKDDELNQIKKNYKQLQQKIVKFKGQNQQAMAARKPWVCLSCDKQDKQVKKQPKIKKPQPFKGFGQQKSEKNLKPPPTPPFEQRFEVYEKLRQKYLSDTIKLPQILKQKLRDKETSLQN